MQMRELVWIVMMALLVPVLLLVAVLALLAVPVLVLRWQLVCGHWLHGLKLKQSQRRMQVCGTVLLPPVDDTEWRCLYSQSRGMDF